MEFLRLNGWPIPVAVNTPEAEYEEVGGERTVAFDGTPLSTRTRVKRALRFTTTHLDAVEARALAGVLLGEGRYWPFDQADGFWDVKGLNFDSGTASIITTDVVYGDGALLVESDFSVDVGFESPWSILFWRGVYQAPGGGSSTAFVSSFFPASFDPADFINWAHYCVRSDGAKWRNGERMDEIDTQWITMSSGILTLKPDVDSLPDHQNAFDDLVVLPFLAPDKLVKGVYNLGRPYGRIPRIDVQGLATNDLVLQMEGEPPNSPYHVWGINGAWHADGQRVTGRLVEV